MFVFMFFITKVSGGNDTIPVKKANISPKKVEVLNDKNLYREILNQGILYPDIAFSQALLESNHFKSHLARRNKNLFGMVVSERRDNVSIGRRSGYAVYKNWIASVVDYKIWQDNIPSSAKVSKASYYKYVQKKYSHTKSYCKMVKGIVKSYQKVFADTSQYEEISMR